MEYVVGVDIGTGSVKTVAVNEAGKPLEASLQHYSFSSPKSGYHEQDPEEIWQAFDAGLKDITAKMGSTPSAVGLSSAMHSLIAVDNECYALAPMMTWADNRSAQIAQRLKESEPGFKIYRATGTPLHAMSPLCKLIWLRENEPELFQNSYKFISIKEYIWYRLFREFKIDYSLASATGLFNIYELIWHAEALALAGITQKQLSEPVPTDYSRQLSGVHYLIGASDGCTANLGSMAHQPGAAAITIGTSGAVRIASRVPLPDDEAMTFSYILDNETFICGGPVNNGGIALQWWLKNISAKEITDDDYSLIFQQIEGIDAGSNGLLFVPYLTGERAPVWDSESCGLFFGIKLEHEQSHFSRAVVEGICFSIKDVLDAVEKNTMPLSHIHISGGMVRSETWMQILADITGKHLIVVQTDDASAIGAALMAMKKVGLIDRYPDFDAGDARIIQPNPKNPTAYSTSFSIYKKLYPLLKETMHQLNS